MGSKKHDLVEESLIKVPASSSLTASKALNGGDKVRPPVEEPEVGNVSQILMIYVW